MTTPLAEIVELLKANMPAEEVYGVDTPLQVTMLMEDGTFKVKPLQGNEEFQLKGIREGKKDLIFEFVPLDVRPYKQIEFPQSKVFATFPELEAHLVTALGFDAADQAPPLTFNQALKRYKEEAVARAEKAAADEEAGKYENNSAWGMF